MVGVACSAFIQTPVSQRLGTPGSVGHLLPGVRAKIVRPDGTLAGYDEPGELVVTGPQMTLGYPNNAQACVPFILYHFTLETE